MTISRNGDIVSLSMKPYELAILYKFLGTCKDVCLEPIANVIEGYYQTYEC